MYDERTRDEAVKYIVLTNWLAERLENNEKINLKELERLLSSLDVEVKHKVQELKEKAND